MQITNQKFLHIARRLANALELIAVSVAVAVVPALLVWGSLAR